MIWVNLLIEEWLKQTPFVRRFANIRFVCFMILPVHQVNTLCSISHYVDCVYIISLKSDLSKTQCVRWFTKIHSVFCMMWPVKKQTRYILIYCVDLGYFCSLKSYLSRQTLLAILIWFFLLVSKLYQWENQTLCVR